MFAEIIYQDWRLFKDTPELRDKLHKARVRAEQCVSTLRKTVSALSDE